MNGLTQTVSITDFGEDEPRIQLCGSVPPLGAAEAPFSTSVTGAPVTCKDSKKDLTLEFVVN